MDQIAGKKQIIFDQYFCRLYAQPASTCSHHCAWRSHWLLLPKKNLSGGSWQLTTPSKPAVLVDKN